MKYSTVELGQIEALINMLGGEEGMKCFLSGKTKVVNTHFDVWKTIKLGTVKSVDDFPKKMGAYKSDNPGILNSPAFTLVPEEVEVDLVVCTPFEFGFKEGATKEQMYMHAMMCGLELCPAEVGPQLHLQWADRVANQGVKIAMGPISDGNALKILEVGTNFHGQYLSDVMWKLESHIFEPSCKFVFVKPRK